MKIIPAIDIVNGHCVRLSQGDYERQTTYFDDPLDAAERFWLGGYRQLHLVDLDGAKEAKPVNLDVLKCIAGKFPDMKVEWGGGLKSAESIRQVFDAGATWAICGSVAAVQPEMFEAWIDEFGAERMVLGADARDGKIATHGWLKASEWTIETLIERFPKLRRAIVTDISRDGMLCGVDVEFYKRLQDRFPQVEITVSGGIASLDEIPKLEAAELRSAVVGKAFYV